MIEFGIKVFLAPAVAATTTIPSSSSDRLPSSSSDCPPGVRTDGSPAYYRDLLLKEFDDILVDALPNKLPPLREINHRIPYKPKNPEKPLIAHKYRLPEAHKRALEQDVAAKLESGILAVTTEVPLAASHMVPKQQPDELSSCARSSETK